MYTVMLEAAQDYRTDASLNEWCHKDAAKFCADVELGKGRIQECLVRIRVWSRQSPVPRHTNGHVACAAPCAAYEPDLHTHQCGSRLSGQTGSRARSGQWRVSAEDRFFKAASS